MIVLTQLIVQNPNMTNMIDMIYITNITVFSHRTTVTKHFLEIYNHKYTIMICEKVFVQSIECD